ncbi:Phosphatidylinositol transfer protein 3 [Linum perenne]
MFRRRANAHQEPENESQQQQAKINELKAAIGPLSGRSSMYCSDACYKRYLEARNWNVEKAKKMLKDTLEWRSSYKPEEIRWPEIAHEGETGKIFRASFCDRQGRSVLILRPGMQVVKYFLDPRTIEKVKFVYPKNQESVEVMRAFFDDHNLPAVFGGESNLEYDHAEFSKLMLQDDVKTASFWGFDQQLQPPVVTNGHHTHGTEVGPET